jgi:hypothetical protein
MLGFYLLAAFDLSLVATFIERSGIFGNRVTYYKSIGLLFIVGYIELGMSA